MLICSFLIIRQDLQARPGATYLERAVVTVILRKQKLYNSVTESQVWARDEHDIKFYVSI